MRSIVRDYSGRYSTHRRGLVAVIRGEIGVPGKCHASGKRYFARLTRHG